MAEETASQEVIEEAADTASTGEESQPAGGSRTYTAEENDRIVKARIDKQRQKYDARIAEIEAERTEALERASKAEERAAALEHERELAEWAKQAAAEAGVPAGIVKGSTLEEMQEHAKAIKAAMPGYPVIASDAGPVATPATTKEEIYRIKDPKARVMALGTHDELF